MNVKQAVAPENVCFVVVVLFRFLLFLSVLFLCIHFTELLPWP